VFLVKVSYKESIGVRGDRIAPTIGDLARVRDFKGLKDLIHKPKTTMILDHAPHAVEILKFGGLNYAEFKNFVYTVEDLFFELSSSRANKYASYTKDELNIDVQDEYCADIDRGKLTDRSLPLNRILRLYNQVVEVITSFESEKSLGLPFERLPSQPQNVAALWPVPNYTA